MTKPFPTIWMRGNNDPLQCNEAGFYIDFKLVRVPLKFGSSDMSLHVIPWLFRYWPFVLKKNRLVKIMPDGEHRDLAKEFARVKYRDIGYEFENIVAVDGNWLNWTGSNIKPKRDPNASATENEKANEVERRIYEAKTVTDYQGRTELEFLNSAFKDMRRAVTATLHSYDSILSIDASIGINTDISTTLTNWERAVTNDFKVGDAERINEVEKKESPLVQKAVERIPDKHPFHDGGADPLPAQGAYKKPNEDEEEIQFAAKIRTVPIALHEPASQYAVVERVLNAFGWVTPENGHKPTYEGRDSKQVWLRTQPVAWAPRTIHGYRLQADLKVYEPSEPLPVREVIIGEVPSRPIKICTCAFCSAPREEERLDLVTIEADGFVITLPRKQAARWERWYRELEADTRWHLRFRLPPVGIRKSAIIDVPIKRAQFPKTRFSGGGLLVSDHGGQTFMTEMQFKAYQALPPELRNFIGDPWSNLSDELI